MRNVLFLLLVLLCCKVNSQCPTSGQEHILSSQEKVDAFVQKYSNCKRIEGSIDIVQALVGTEDTGEIASPITDITGLYFLEVINGNLRISVELEELDGFNNLTDVNGHFVITGSNSLVKISGFNKLVNAKSVTIALNPVLKTVGGFESLSRVFESLEIGNSPGIETISGFENLRLIGEELNISKNPVLISMPSFNKVESIGDDLNLTLNPILEEAIGFEELTYIGNDLNIEAIKIIRGFDKLQIIERFFDIRGQGVEEIPSFPVLENVGAAFRIANTSIRSIEGFDFLTRLGEKYFLEDWFILSNNKNLSSVKGFGRFEKVEGFVEVQNNPLLSDCSWLCNLINNGEITGALIIQNNIGTCINATAVILLCDPDFDDDGIANVVDLDDDNDGILDTLEGNTLIDTDKDGYPDSMDLDSDGDQCFDVIESGFEDPNNDGVLGDLPDTVNFQGKIINENTGYTNPADKNSNGTYDFQEMDILSPGKSNVLAICRNENPIDLFDVLLGNPDRGGVWSPALISGSSLFDPSIEAQGVYTYTHSDPICGDLSAEIKVEFPSELTPGADSEIIVCEDTGLLNLFDALDGNPSPSGFWSPALKSGTNIYNPEVDVENSYNYTIVDRECGTLQAKMTIRKSITPDTGSDAKITICEFDNEINLRDILGGEPDKGGVWSPGLPEGVFNPQINTSGRYVYTIDNGACGTSTSAVEVEVIKNSRLNNVVLRIHDFSSKNNSIQVFVPSNRSYEYSLDGIQYQANPIFNNVPGGEQTMYIRGVNGCEYYIETFFVKTYMNFFTPNNDGANDFWRLKDFPEVNYTIFIYNRFGQLLEEIKNRPGFWDGTYQGKNAKSGNYWFKVVTENGEVYHGNFSLLRK